MTGDELTAETEVLMRRTDVLTRLCESPAHVRNLVEETGQSRRTISRAVNELEEFDLVERGPDGIEVTTAGRLALERFEEFLSDLEHILTAEEVLEPLPPEADVDPAVVAGGEGVLRSGPTPYQPLQQLYDDLADATAYWGLLPTVEDPRHVWLLYEHVVTEGHPAELVVTPEVFRSLRREFPRRLEAMATEEGFEIAVGDVPPFGLELLAVPQKVTRVPVTTAYVLVFDENHGFHGLVANDSDGAVEWAEEIYAATRAEATDRTDDLLSDTDGDGAAESETGERDSGDGSGRGDVSLPVVLEREGFVGVGTEYFRDEPGADPPTAWRAGLSLVEVHTGYAIERDEVTGEVLSDHLTSRLSTGTNCLLVGSPGSGKSTVCKQVACGWYDADRGPVYYRRGDRGHAFSSVSALIDVATAVDGHALVVVEDAVRADADAVFEAMDRLADRDDVSFLLDARDGEWRTRSHLSPGEAALAVVHVPPLNKEDCDRLVRHFERTTGRSVDVSADHLWADVSDDGGDDQAGTTHGMLRLVHRLATYADPLSDNPTALEEAVASVHDDVADDPLALSVCVLANALNAAGLEADRGLLYAVADPAEFETVDDAIDRLTGRILFGHGDGRYRTVHEEWSTTFLAHLVAAGETPAARRVGSAVSALLALADDADRRGDIVNHVDETAQLARIRDEPQQWVDETLEAVYATARKRPKLAPLLGDGTTDSVELPGVCTATTAARRLVWQGEAFLAGGFYDRAERAFERLSGRGGEFEVDRLLGLARVENARGNPAVAAEHCRACLAVLGEREQPIERGRVRLELATALTKQGELTEAEEVCAAGLDAFRESGADRLTASALKELGGIATRRCEYDRARGYFEESVELARSLGDRRAEAESLNALAWVPWRRGEYDEARRVYERVLEIRRAIGDRPGIAAIHLNLGMLYSELGELDQARDHLERSLEMHTELSDDHNRAKSLQSLGIVYLREREYDDAHECYVRGLEAFEAVGDRYGIGRHLPNVGQIATIRGEYDRATETLERCVDINRELGDHHCEARAHLNLGRVALERGEFEAAERSLETAHELFEQQDDPSGQGAACKFRGVVACRRGELGLATERFERCKELFTAADAFNEAQRVQNDLGVVAKMRGDAERARELHERAVAEEDYEEHARGHCYLVAIALDEGAVHRAREHVDAASEVASRVRTAVRLQVDLCRSAVSSAEGDAETAKELARAAREEAESMGARYWQAMSTRLLGQVAYRVGEYDSARSHWETALASFEALEAYPDALETVDLLVALAERRVEQTAVEEWRQHRTTLLKNGPDALRDVVEQNPVNT